MENILRARRAFTLIEIIVVVAVTAFLSSILILYSGSSRAQVALNIEKSKIVQIVLRAKSLAIATYAAPTQGGAPVAQPCGYGVRFDYENNSYDLFSYAESNCAAITSINAADSNPNYKAIGRFPLGNELAFGAKSGHLESVLFLPPDPETRIWIDGVRQVKDTPGTIHLTTKDTSASVDITIGSGGQVSY